METAGKVFVGLGVGCLVFIFIGIAGFATCATCTGAAISAGMEEADREEAQGLAVAKQRLPWLASVEQACERYKAAPNDIQKSAVFNENQDFVRGKQLTNIQGNLESATTGHGGGGLLLKTRVGGASFLSSFIGQDSPLYTQAGELVPGQCVTFSGAVEDTSLGFEQSRVCDMDFMLNFTAIAACPAGASQKN